MGTGKRETLSVGNTACVARSHFDEAGGIDLKGWYGIIRQIFTEEDAPNPREFYGLIEWDYSEITDDQLQHIHKLYHLEKDWSTSVLPLAWLRRSEKPFSSVSNEWAKNRIGHDFFWKDFPEHSDLIRSIFPQNKSEQSESPYSIWEQTLLRELSFPIRAAVSYPYEIDEGDLQLNDTLRITGLAGWDHPLGIFVEVEKRKRSWILPLQDLEGAGSKKQNSWIEAYQIWLECRA